MGQLTKECSHSWICVGALNQSPESTSQPLASMHEPSGLLPVTKQH